MAFFRKTFLNPSQKAQRFAKQLKDGKVMETNKTLSNEDKKYRQGYLSARRDNAEAYCAKNGITSKSKERRKQYFANKKNQNKKTRTRKTTAKK